ncbi:MAG: hypothetical protein ACI9J4_001678 [Paraglaciecola sp.]|jgi:hypothetical protein
MAFDEVHCRIRQGYADQNMAILRHISLNLLTSDKDNKVKELSLKYGDSIPHLISIFQRSCTRRFRVSLIK